MTIIISSIYPKKTHTLLFFIKKIKSFFICQFVKEEVKFCFGQIRKVIFRMKKNDLTFFIEKKSELIVYELFYLQIDK